MNGHMALWLACGICISSKVYIDKKPIPPSIGMCLSLACEIPREVGPVRLPLCGQPKESKEIGVSDHLRGSIRVGPQDRIAHLVVEKLDGRAGA